RTRRGYAHRGSRRSCRATRAPRRCRRRSGPSSGGDPGAGDGDSISAMSPRPYNRESRNTESMKVFNLACGHDHRFEGWFASAEDFDGQLERGLIECPVCGDRTIRKLPSAPRLNLSGATEPAAMLAPGKPEAAVPAP